MCSVIECVLCITRQGSYHDHLSHHQAMRRRQRRMRRRHCTRQNMRRRHCTRQRHTRRIQRHYAAHCYTCSFFFLFFLFLVFADPHSGFKHHGILCVHRRRYIRINVCIHTGTHTGFFLYMYIYVFFPSMCTGMYT